MRAARKAALTSRTQRATASALPVEPQTLERRKAAQAFRTIAEVSDDLGIAKHVLRFWEIKFTQLRPMKRGGGRRFYRPDDVELLRGIRHLLQAEAFTIKGVQKILREQGVEVVKRAGADLAKTDSGVRDRRRGRSVIVSVDDLAQAQAGAPGATRTAGLATVAARSADTVAMTSAIRAAIRELEAVRTALSGELSPVSHEPSAGRAP